MTLYDYDGSVLMTGKPSIVGSHKDWWNVGEDCDKTEWKVWRCDWTWDRQVAYMEILVLGLSEGCDDDVSFITRLSIYPRNICNNLRAECPYAQRREMRDDPKSLFDGLCDAMGK